jgi:hypothetical protein
MYSTNEEDVHKTMLFELSTILVQWELYVFLSWDERYCIVAIVCIHECMEKILMHVENDLYYSTYT